MANGKTFFQAVDDKDTRVEPAGGLWTPLTFEEWLDKARPRFNELMGAEKYAFEVALTFYPDGGIDGIVPVWESGMTPEAYAQERYHTVRGK